MAATDLGVANVSKRSRLSGPGGSCVRCAFSHFSCTRADCRRHHLVVRHDAGGRVGDGGSLSAGARHRQLAVQQPALAGRHRAPVDESTWNACHAWLVFSQGWRAARCCSDRRHGAPSGPRFAAYSPRSTGRSPAPSSAVGLLLARLPLCSVLSARRTSGESVAVAQLRWLRGLDENWADGADGTVVQIAGHKGYVSRCRRSRCATADYLDIPCASPGAPHTGCVHGVDRRIHAGHRLHGLHHGRVGPIGAAGWPQGSAA
jgi:hypothetical protein